MFADEPYAQVGCPTDGGWTGRSAAAAATVVAAVAECHRCQRYRFGQVERLPIHNLTVPHPTPLQIEVKLSPGGHGRPWIPPAADWPVRARRSFGRLEDEAGRWLTSLRCQELVEENTKPTSCRAAAALTRHLPAKVTLGTRQTAEASPQFSVLPAC